MTSLWRMRIFAIIFATVAVAQQWQVLDLNAKLSSAIGIATSQTCDLKHTANMIKLVNEFLAAHELFEDFSADWREEAERYHKACHSGVA